MHSQYLYQVKDDVEMDSNKPGLASVKVSFQQVERKQPAAPRTGLSGELRANLHQQRSIFQNDENWQNSKFSVNSNS